MAKKDDKKKQRRLHLAILKQLVTLSTSGFGLVAALAWNSLIQDVVNNYIRPYFAASSSTISLFIYAVIITVVAVTVTYNLTKLTEKVEELDERFRRRD